MDWNDPDSVERMLHIKEQIVDPFFEQPTGTLLAVLGVKDEQLHKMIVDLDDFTGWEPINLQKKQKTRNDEICIPAFMRFKTLLGSWLVMDQLLEAGFDRADVGQPANSRATYAAHSSRLYMLMESCSYVAYLAAL